MMPIRLTPTVKALLIAYVAIFFVQQTADQFFGQRWLELFALVPSEFINSHHFWQLFTYSFLHADVMHLFLNLLMFVFIGGELESIWGSARFLRFYLGCTTAAGLCYLLLNLFVWRDIPMVGASGGIYGLLMAYGLLFGERVLLFMMIFPMKAKHFVWVLAGVEFTSSLFSGRGALSSVAHLGGMATGFAWLWGRAAWAVYRRKSERDRDQERRLKRRKSSKHLKLVVNRGRVSIQEESDESDENPKTWH